MSITGLDIRGHARRRLALVLDGLADRLEAAEQTDTPEPEAVAPAPATPPAKADAPLPPLPTPDVRKAGPLADAPTSDKKPKAPAKAKAPKKSARTPAADKAAQSPEDRAAAHWARTRDGLLRFIHESGGRVGLRELHDHSERTFFVAHVKFSEMMEQLTTDELIEYDHDTAVATLTEAGRAEIL